MSESRQGIPPSVQIAGLVVAGVVVVCIAALLLLNATGLLPALLGVEPTAVDVVETEAAVAQATEPPATEEITVVPPTVTDTPTESPTDAPTATLTPLPSPTPLGEEDDPTEASPTAAAEATAVPTMTPTVSEEQVEATSTLPNLIPGTFDVYLGAPDENGVQMLRWVEITGSSIVNQIEIQTHDGSATRAGRYVYWLTPSEQMPTRANTAGEQEELPFAAPPPGADYYELLPSATGLYLAWVIIEDGRFELYIAPEDGSEGRLVLEGPLEDGESLRLVRVTNDGTTIFVDRRPDEVVNSLFNGFYDIIAVDVDTGDLERLPGEPACGEFIACGARISPDGAFLARTLPQGISEFPVVVTNLLSGTTIARFAPIEVPEGARFVLGDPIFTPGGELVYMAAVGAEGLESYALILANLVTEDQEVVSELGSEKHRALGWAGDGFSLLTTREGLYDTWQIDTTDGDAQQIAGMLFIGSIVEPPID